MINGLVLTETLVDEFTNLGLQSLKPFLLIETKIVNSSAKSKLGCHRIPTYAVLAQRGLDQPWSCGSR